MLRLFRPSRKVTEKTVTKPKARQSAQTRISPRERHRLADTDGKRRRMLQTIEDNRLL